MTTLDELEALDRAAGADPTRMPELLAMSRRVMHDGDAEARGAAVHLAWYALRQLFPRQTPAERVAACEAVSVDLEAAVAAGVTGTRAMIVGPLRGLVQRMRDRGGQLE